VPNPFARLDHCKRSPLYRSIPFVPAPLHAIAIGADDLVVSAHACGPLTDDVFARTAALAQATRTHSTASLVSFVVVVEVGLVVAVTAIRRRRQRAA
jgi:hypothetical protein